MLNARDNRLDTQIGVYYVQCFNTLTNKIYTPYVLGSAKQVAEALEPFNMSPKFLTWEPAANYSVLFTLPRDALLFHAYMLESTVTRR